MPARVPIEPELLERMNREVLRRVDTAVADCADRDKDLLAMRDALRGLPTESGNDPWPGSCRMVDKLLREHHIAVVAAMVSQLRQPPYWIVEPTDPTSEESSADVEEWLSTKAAQCGYNTALYEAAYNAAAYPFAPIYVGWEDRVTKTRGEMYEDVETGELVNAKDRQPDRQYERQDVLHESVEDGRVYYQAIQPWDWYLYPSNSRSVKEATAVIQRVMLTREALIAGINDQGFDRDAVNTVVKAGQSPQGSVSEIQREFGISPTQNQDQPVECYVVYGRLPILIDDDAVVTPEHLMGEDFVWWLVPSVQDGVVLKCEPWELPERPYTVCSIYPEPGYLNSECIVSLLSEMAEEATVMVRLMINAANLEVSPILLVPKNRESEFDTKSVFPGGVLGQTQPGEISALTWPMNGPGMAMQQIEYLNARASQMIATRNYGEVGSGKVRKSSEIQAAESMMQSKFDLFLQNFQQPGLSDIARLMIMYYVSRGGAQYSANRNEITRDTLDARYRFTPHASTGMSDPNVRMQVTRAKLDAQGAYQAKLLQTVTAMMQGQLQLELGTMLASETYHGTRRLLEDTSERNPDSWIGPDPQTWLPNFVKQMQQQQAVAQAQAQAQMAQMAPIGGPNGAGPNLPPAIARAALAQAGAGANGTGNGQ